MAQAESGETRHKVPNQESDKKEHKYEILQTQYKIAVDLYKHEDELNWKKLHNLFYVTSALLVILGLSSRSVDNFPDDVEPSMLIFISLAGILISISFAVAIWSGTFYLGERKERVKAIEKKLKMYGGVSIVGFRYKNETNITASKNQQLDSARTKYTLKGIPIAVMLGWIILLIYCILN